MMGYYWLIAIGFSGGFLYLEGTPRVDCSIGIQAACDEIEALYSTPPQEQSK